MILHYHTLRVTINSPQGDFFKHRISFIDDYFVLQQQQGQEKNLDLMELGAKDFLWSSVNYYTLNIVLNIEKLY